MANPVQRQQSDSPFVDVNMMDTGLSEPSQCTQSGDTVLSEPSQCTQSGETDHEHSQLKHFFKRIQGVQEEFILKHPKILKMLLQDRKEKEEGENFFEENKWKEEMWQMEPEAPQKKEKGEEKEEEEKWKVEEGEKAAEEEPAQEKGEQDEKKNEEGTLKTLGQPATKDSLKEGCRLGSSLKIRQRTHGSGRGESQQSTADNSKTDKTVATTLSSLPVARINGGAAGGGDDGDGRPPKRPGHEKRRSGCLNRPKKKKKETKKGEAKTEASPPSLPENSRGHENHLHPGARPKQPRPGQAAADLSSTDPVHPLTQSLSQMALSRQDRPRWGSSGRTRQSGQSARAMARYLSGPRPERRLHQTARNVAAVERLLGDAGAHGRAQQGGAAPGERLAGHEPMEVDEPSAEADPWASGNVVFGPPDSVPPFIEHLQRNPQRQSGGVIMTGNEGRLVIANGQYTEQMQYQRVICLGSGSFGDVYLLEDTCTKYRMVGKRVFLERLAPNEALVWCRLEHPNISTFMGLTLSEATVLFLSEHHQGAQDLQELLKIHGPFGQGHALYLIHQVFLALEYLAARRIIHKDIKLDNLLVLEDHIWLIDFGLSMEMTGSQHKDNEVKGTECFMAPEIAGCGHYDARVDVWSTFCAFINLISGHPPWAVRFKGIRVKIYLIATSEAPLCDIPEGTDPRVRDFIASGLVKDFRRRPTAAEVLHQFPSDNVVEELHNVSAIDTQPQLQPDPEPELHDQGGDPTPRGPMLPPGSRGLLNLNSLPSSVFLDDSLEIPASVGSGSEDLYGSPMDTSMRSPANQSQDLDMTEEASFEIYPFHSAQQRNPDDFFKGLEFTSPESAGPARNGGDDGPGESAAAREEAGTSGIGTHSPGHSIQYNPHASCVQGIYVSVFLRGAEKFRMKAEPSFTAEDLAHQIRRHPDCRKALTGPFTLHLQQQWRDTFLTRDETFTVGDNQVEVVEPFTGRGEVWLMDLQGNVIM